MITNYNYISINSNTAIFYANQVGTMPFFHSWVVPSCSMLHFVMIGGGGGGGGGHTGTAGTQRGGGGGGGSGTVTRFTIERYKLPDILYLTVGAGGGGGPATGGGRPGRASRIFFQPVWVATTTTASTAAGGTALTVASIANINASDPISFDLSSGPDTSHFVAVSGTPAGSTVNFTTPVPTGTTVPNGANVYVLSPLNLLATAGGGGPGLPGTGAAGGTAGSGGGAASISSAMGLNFSYFNSTGGGSGTAGSALATASSVPLAVGFPLTGGAGGSGTTTLDFDSAGITGLGMFPNLNGSNAATVINGGSGYMFPVNTTTIDVAQLGLAPASLGPISYGGAGGCSKNSAVGGIGGRGGYGAGGGGGGGGTTGGAGGNGGDGLILVTWW